MSGGKRNETKIGTLRALMPGVSIKKHSGKILVNVATSNETVTFNIGGTRFETFKSTLHRLPNSPFADQSFLIKHYREEDQEYFFDRDPEIFKAILQYLRTGELHLPSSLCGSAIKNELEFWGVDEANIEDCCWLNYNSWSQTLESLKKLEEDRQSSMGTIRNFHSGTEKPWQKIRDYGWEFLNNPNWSTGSKMYGGLSVIFVFLSIFSYVAQTHDYFTVHPAQSTDQMYQANISSILLNTTNSSKVFPLHTPVHDLTKLTHPVLFTIDCVCFAFFCCELVLRFICCPSKLRYFTRPMNIIDSFALLPDIVSFFALYFGADPTTNSGLYTAISLLRVMRVFRSFRLMRFFPGLWILFYTLKASINELLLMLLFVIIGMLVFSSLIYYAEERDNFPSIPRAFWWAVITMTTVGYGDMYPVSNMGYLVGSMTAISGLLLIGFTVPVLVNNFILYYNYTQCAMEREKHRELRRHEHKSRQKMEKNGYETVKQPH